MRRSCSGILARTLHLPDFLKGNRVRIVVVEDNISVAKGIRYYLQDAGHAVDLIHDGEEAAAFLQDDDADMVVLDINLPNKNGAGDPAGHAHQG